MGQKIIRLTESDLARIVKRVLNEQPEKDHVKMASDMLSRGPKPTEPGAKYCFSKDNLTKNIKGIGVDYIKLYKIKTGDSLGKLQNMTMQDGALHSMNPLCDLKNKNGVRANDVIVLNLRESQ
jgi:kynurenine formamidase